MSIWLLPIILLSIAALDWSETLPHWYFDILRIVICANAGLIAYRRHKGLNKPDWIVWLFICIAVLFNPLRPISFDRSLWQQLDVVVLLVYLVPFAKWAWSSLTKSVDAIAELANIIKVVAICIVFLTIFFLIETNQQPEYSPTIEQPSNIPIEQSTDETTTTTALPTDSPSVFGTAFNSPPSTEVPLLRSPPPSEVSSFLKNVGSDNCYDKCDTSEVGGSPDKNVENTITPSSPPSTDSSLLPVPVTNTPDSYEQTVTVASSTDSSELLLLICVTGNYSGEIRGRDSNGNLTTPTHVTTRIWLDQNNKLKGSYRIFKSLGDYVDGTFYSIKLEDNHILINRMG